MKIVVLFNLRPEVDAAAYERWACSVDIPIVRSLSSIVDFNVYRATGLLGSDGRAPYQYVEIIDAAGEVAFAADAASEKVRALAEEFRSFADNPQFIVVEAL